MFDARLRQCQALTAGQGAEQQCKPHCSVERALMPLSTRAVSPPALHTMAKGWPRGSTARWLPEGCQLSASTGASAASSNKNSGSGTVMAVTTPPLLSKITTFFFCTWSLNS